MKSWFKETKHSPKCEKVLSSTAGSDTILRFLELNEISHYARISKSINTSVKSRLNSYLFQQDHFKPEVSKLISKDALMLYEKHPVSANAEESKKLDKALKDLMQGNVTEEALDEISKHEFKGSASSNGVPCGSDKSLQNYRKQEVLSQASDISLNVSKGILKTMFESDEENVYKIDSDKALSKLEIAALVMSGVFAIGGGIMRGASYIWRCLEDRAAERSHRKLKNSVELLKGNFERKDDGKKDDESNSGKSIFRPW